MKKFIIIFLLLVAKFSSTQAGAYVGVGIGGNILSGKQSLAVSSNATGPLALRYGLRDTAVSAEILAGYGYIWHSTYFGFEGSYSFLHTKSNFGSKIGAQDESFATKLSNGYGAAARCGYCTSDNTLIYLRMGMDSRKFSLHFQDPNRRFIPFNKSYRSNAFVPGLGIETKLSSKVAFRLEGKAAFYPQKSFNIYQNALNYTRIKTKPRLYSLTAAITYTF